MKQPIGSPIKDIFFENCNLGQYEQLVNSKESKELLLGKICYFSNLFRITGSPPCWFVGLEKHKNHWSGTNDFTYNQDIKLIWEPSRFHWLVLAAKGFRSTKNNEYISLINDWLLDWSYNNPVNRGPNWKCGQEASLRVINIFLTSKLLNKIEYPSNSIKLMLEQHCERIYSTLHYAIGQDNNHATSELAALYITGAWFKFLKFNLKKSKKWLNRGKSGLIERVNYLVLSDGSFSQYSVTYQRLFIDTMSVVEISRSIFGLKPFETNFYVKIRKSVNWLHQMTEPDTGNAPNLGANDGAHLLQVNGIKYRDFRPSIQLASVLFNGFKLYENCEDILKEFDLDKKYKINPKKRNSQVFEDGGFVSFIGQNCSAILRYPKFTFRPSHADFLSIELFNNGFALLRDGGTYSYNTKEKWLNYFPSIKSHNTVQFDNSEPMPKLSRFLFGNWPEAHSIKHEINFDKTKWEGAYIDYLGRSHHRGVSLNKNKWIIEDTVTGKFNEAILRWRLKPINWDLKDNQLISDEAVIRIDSIEKTKFLLRINEGWESLHYNSKTKIQVLEVTLNQKCTIRTTIELK